MPNWPRPPVQERSVGTSEDSTSWGRIRHYVAQITRVASSAIARSCESGIPCLSSAGPPLLQFSTSARFSPACLAPPPCGCLFGSCFRSAESADNFHVPNHALSSHRVSNRKATDKCDVISPTVTLLRRRNHHIALLRGYLRCTRLPLYSQALAARRQIEPRGVVGIMGLTTCSEDAHSLC
jgi:hypothetical protein